ncbi:hypothetical protein F5Y17DRAFT_434279 [Xylariaceae sp. FL0594]|nr:hypothetical protein F5Y17DRAFT_434279 [Xylariaceae sp. FL0594]
MHDMLALQSVFFASPDLVRFELCATLGTGPDPKCGPDCQAVMGFQLSVNEPVTFPPLQYLRLDGYLPAASEFAIWRESFQWRELQSLSLFKPWTMPFLALAAGYAEAVRSLCVVRDLPYGARDGFFLPELDNFLASFMSLEKLTINGYHLSTTAVLNHPGLTSLEITIGVPIDADTPRPTLTARQLEELDKSCPVLRYLSFYIYRDGVWPEDVLEVLVTGFRHLRSLHLDFDRRFGRPEQEGNTQPFLNKHTTWELAKRFLRWRSPAPGLLCLDLWLGERGSYSPEENGIVWQKRDVFQVRIPKGATKASQIEMTV